MLILGIDPGTTTTGFGIIGWDGKKHICIDYGVISTKPKIPQELKLKEIYTDLKKIINKHKPQLISIEKIYFNTNPKTVISVSQARGICLLAAARKNINIVEFTPLQVKSAICGYGRAEKKQVIYMVRNLLKLQEDPKPDDAADALAIAICASTQVDYNKQLTNNR